MTKLQRDFIKNWLASAEEDRKTALDLFKLKRYAWSLFIFHLAIEKLFKAHLVKNDQSIPYTHKLVKLAKLAKLEFSFLQEKQLVEISDYNLKARYDIEKMEFYKKSDKIYTKKWLTICGQVFDWLKKLL